MKQFTDQCIRGVKTYGVSKDNSAEFGDHGSQAEAFPLSCSHGETADYLDMGTAGSG